MTHHLLNYRLQIAGDAGVAVSGFTVRMRARTVFVKRQKEALRRSTNPVFEVRSSITVCVKDFTYCRLGKAAWLSVSTPFFK